MKFLSANKLLLLFFLFFQLLASAQVAERPSPERLVNNLSSKYANLFSAEEEKQLEDTLRAISNNSSNQICVVIVDDLAGLTAFDYAVQVLNKWGVGQKSKNNGVVLLIKQSETSGDRAVAITVGYGLEGAITDLETKRITQNEIIPEFKQGNYFKGIMNGCRSLAVAAVGEYNDKNVDSKSSKLFAWAKRHPILSIIIVLFIFYLLSKMGGGGGSSFGGRGFRTIGAFGAFGAFGGGSFGGGSSGGGFGGFGGGSGGGGGSSSNW